jgi:hypothetical protein
VIPFILKDESIAGGLMRLSLLRCDSSLNLTARYFMGVDRFRTSLMPGNFAMLCQTTEGFWGSVRELVENHNPLAASMHLTMTAADRAQLIVSLEHGATYLREFSYGVLGKFSERVGSRYCCECAREQTKEFRFTYWKVDWEYPGVFACPVHNVSLTSGCGRCELSQPSCKVIRFPSERCFCGNDPVPLVKGPELETHCRIARILMLAKNSGRYFRR